jgi:hypothetical protein
MNPNTFFSVPLCTSRQDEGHLFRAARYIHDRLDEGSLLRKEVSLHIRPMNSIAVNTNYTIPVNAEHYSFHVNIGTTESDHLRGSVIVR